MEGGILDLIGSLVPLFVAAVSMVGSAYAYFKGARKQEMDAVNTRIDDLSDELSEHKRSGENSRLDLRERMVKVEKDLAQLPTKDAFHDLALSNARIEGDLKALTVSVNASAASSKRIEQWLVEKGGGAS